MNFLTVTLHQKEGLLLQHRQKSSTTSVSEHNYVRTSGCRCVVQVSSGVCGAICVVGWTLLSCNLEKKVWSCACVV